jgi:hypothetical protein
MPYGGEGISRYESFAPTAGLAFDSGNANQVGGSADYRIYTGRTTGTGATGRPSYEVQFNTSFQPGSTSAYFVDQGATTVGIAGSAYAGDATMMYFPVTANGYVYSVDDLGTAGTSYIANNTGTVTTLTALNNGSLITGLTSATGIAVDHASHVWVTAPGGNAVYSIPTGTTGSTPTAYTTGLYEPTGIAIDHSNDAWVINSSGGTPSTGYIAEISSGGSIKADTVAAHGGINTPSAIAIDGAGNIWVASSGTGTTFTGQTVSELSSAGGIHRTIA